VRGQKCQYNQRYRIKEKTLKRNFTKKQNQGIDLFKFFNFNFLHNLKTVVFKSFLTPHVSADLTTVKFAEPAPPQGLTPLQFFTSSEVLHAVAPPLRGSGF
jgi:hypothetical protein